ncbi:hypothetical protein [Streptomyces angustmyceticus]|uniref:hypothetical protein n=1 Tax=Streptomyces angustmyceticus TaxID=285578 RepID=UPI00344ED7B9
MRVQDVANHPGTSGYVRIDHANRGGLGNLTLGSTTPSRIGRAPEGQPWITRDGTVTITPVDSLPWAYVAHVAGQGLTVYLPDEWASYITLLAGSPPDRWLPAAPGKAPDDTTPRGISADHNEQ